MRDQDRRIDRLESRIGVALTIAVVRGEIVRLKAGLQSRISLAEVQREIRRLEEKRARLTERGE